MIQWYKIDNYFIAMRGPLTRCIPTLQNGRDMVGIWSGSIKRSTFFSLDVPSSHSQKKYVPLRRSIFLPKEVWLPILVDVSSLQVCTSQKMCLPLKGSMSLSEEVYSSQKKYLIGPHLVGPNVGAEALKALAPIIRANQIRALTLPS